MRRENKLYSYIMTSDSGFAPNPFHGICTLATCKPETRRLAKKGDWILGFSGKSLKVYNGRNSRPLGEGKLVYAMIVEKVLSWWDYWEYYPEKRPRHGLIEERGDNIYYRGKDGEWCRTSIAYHKSEKQMLKDLGVKNRKEKPSTCILLSSKFYYFGRKAITILSSLSYIIPKPGTRKHKPFGEKEAKEFERWIKSNYAVGIYGDPCDFRQKFIRQI